MILSLRHTIKEKDKKVAETAHIEISRIPNKGEDMNIRPWADEDIAELRRRIRSEVTVHIVRSSGITEIYITPKREVREHGYIKENELCPNELII